MQVMLSHLTKLPAGPLYSITQRYWVKAGLRSRSCVVLFNKMEINNEIALTVIKWIIIVFVAGIIGQFGKSLTLHVLDWWKKRKAKAQSKETVNKEMPSKKLSKLEKKRKKAEIKRLKKGK